ncbi:trehalose-6-phosphate synthase [Campylobacter sp. MIT 99-7217]|uniref:trehalose-6-phosphate synthase n=1 Tax=Campylobacter sp. MIT 99-7217 TaxID=535091 RepID=UPI00115A0566|nr:trehalose-6-phosphate synthase [Campylobacter sp. MIT 99-7217]TQR31377.1 trehalose-6-phosphate synthase [Campylobacter sp. MIT 99-7217]
MFYVSVKIIHLLCACVVIGYLVYDAFIFSCLKKNRSHEEFISLKRELLKPSVLILALAFFALIITGLMLASFYLGGNLGFWQNNFQKILIVKILVVASLFVFAGISFLYILIFKKPDPFRKFYHFLALVICVLALILAKLLFVF